MVADRAGHNFFLARAINYSRSLAVLR